MRGRNKLTVMERLRNPEYKFIPPKPKKTEEPSQELIDKLKPGVRIIYTTQVSDIPYEGTITLIDDLIETPIWSGKQLHIEHPNGCQSSFPVVNLRMLKILE